jgi:hypothetical protein
VVHCIGGVNQLGAERVFTLLVIAGAAAVHYAPATTMFSVCYMLVHTADTKTNSRKQCTHVSSTTTCVE